MCAESDIPLLLFNLGKRKLKCRDRKNVMKAHIKHLTLPNIKLLRQATVGFIFK